MLNRYLVMAMVTGSVALTVVSCSRQEPAATPAAPAAGQPAAGIPQKDAPQPAATAPPAAGAPDALKQGLSTMVTSLAPSNTLGSGTSVVQTATAIVSNQVQVLIDQAKSMLASQDYQKALAAVQQLYTNTLTPAQRQIVDNLSAQIKAALAKQAGTNAGSVLGNILGGKK